MSPAEASSEHNADRATSVGQLERLDVALGHVRRMWEHPGVRRWIAARIDLDDVDASIFRTLRAANQLGPDGASVNGIAALLRIDPSTASRFLERTRARGFVQRSAAPTDRRRSSFTLTAAGREELRLLRDRRLELLDQLTAHWSSDDTETLIDLLGRFDDALIEFDGAHAD